MWRKIRSYCNCNCVALVIVRVLMLIIPDELQLSCNKRPDAPDARTK